MPLFCSVKPEPFTVLLDYVKDPDGNTIAVTIPIDIWKRIVARYRDIFTNEDVRPDDLFEGEVNEE